MNRFVRLFAVSIIVHGASVHALDSSRGAKHLLAQIVRRTHNPARFALFERPIPNDPRVHHLLQGFLKEHGLKVKAELEAGELREQKQKQEMDFRDSDIACITKVQKKFWTNFIVKFKDGRIVTADKYDRSFNSEPVRRVTDFFSGRSAVLPSAYYDKIVALYYKRERAKKPGKKD